MNVQVLILLVLVLIVASAYVTLRDMPRSTGGRREVMYRDSYTETRDTGFGG